MSQTVAEATLEALRDVGWPVVITLSPTEILITCGEMRYDGRYAGSVEQALFQALIYCRAQLMTQGTK